MNYVYERDYAVLVRLKAPAECAWHRADPRRRALARLHRQDLRARAGPTLARPSDRQRDGQPAQFDEWRRALPRPLATAGHFELAGDKLRVSIPLPAGAGAGKPYLFPATDDVVDYEAPQTFRRVGDTLVAELQHKGDAPKTLSGLVAFDGGRGFGFQADPAMCPEADRLSAAWARMRCCGPYSAQSPAASSST